MHLEEEIAFKGITDGDDELLTNHTMGDLVNYEGVHLFIILPALLRMYHILHRSMISILASFVWERELNIVLGIIWAYLNGKVDPSQPFHQLLLLKQTVMAQDYKEILSEVARCVIDFECYSVSHGIKIHRDNLGRIHEPRLDCTQLNWEDALRTPAVRFSYDGK